MQNSYFDLHYEKALLRDHFLSSFPQSAYSEANNYVYAQFLCYQCKQL